MKTEAESIPRRPDPWDYALVRSPNGNECDENGWPLTHPAAIRRMQYFELLAAHNRAVAKAAVEALTITRGQWIHSVNAEQCLSALREIEESGWTP